MTCPSCGNENAGGGVFCMRCGAPLQRSAGERLAPAASSQTALDAHAPTGASAAPVEYAGFWRRLFAVLIDSIIMQIIVLVPALAVGLALGIAAAAAGQDEQVIEAAGQLLGMVLGLVIGWLYEGLLTASSRQATIGKMALGVMVTDLNGNRISFGRSTGRYFSKIISFLPLMIGYLIQPFTERKQALHDLIAGTLVVKK